MMIRILLAIVSVTATQACKNTDFPTTIPEFSMTLPDTNKVFHSKDIPNGKTVILIQFDPNCRDCQEETEYMLAHMRKFAHTHIYMVTKHPHDELMVFYNHLKLDTCKNLTIGIDEKSTIPKQYGIRSTPITLVYNKEKVLAAVFSGKPNMKKLLEIIH